MPRYNVVRVVEIPDGVEVSLNPLTKEVEVRGPLGVLKRNFAHAPVDIKLEDKKVIVSAFNARKKVAAIVPTIASHIKNAITGVTKGFTYRMKVVTSHFPVSVKVQGDKVVIENFLGEKRPRVAKIVGNVKVKVEKDDIVISGIDKEAVAQTAANIEQATKVKDKDDRVFLDGIYVYSKEEGMEG